MLIRGGIGNEISPQKTLQNRMPRRYDILKLATPYRTWNEYGSIVVARVAGKQEPVGFIALGGGCKSCN